MSESIMKIISIDINVYYVSVYLNMYLIKVFFRFSIIELHSKQKKLKDNIKKKC